MAHTRKACVRHKTFRESRFVFLFIELYVWGFSSFFYFFHNFSVRSYFRTPFPLIIAHNKQDKYFRNIFFQHRPLLPSNFNLKFNFSPQQRIEFNLAFCNIDFSSNQFIGRRQFFSSNFASEVRNQTELKRFCWNEKRKRINDHIFVILKNIGLLGSWWFC